MFNDDALPPLVPDAAPQAAEPSRESDPTGGPAKCEYETRAGEPSADAPDAEAPPEETPGPSWAEGQIVEAGGWRGIVRRDAEGELYADFSPRTTWQLNLDNFARIAELTAEIVSKAQRESRERETALFKELFEAEAMVHKSHLQKALLQRQLAHAYDQRKRRGLVRRIFRRLFG